MLGGEGLVGGVWAEEARGFGVDLVGGEDEGWEGEGAEVGGVDSVAEFEGEGEEAGEELLWIVVSLLIKAIGKEVLCHVMRCAIIGRYGIFVLGSFISSPERLAYQKIAEWGELF